LLIILKEKPFGPKPNDPFVIKTIQEETLFQPKQTTTTNEFESMIKTPEQMVPQETQYTQQTRPQFGTTQYGVPQHQTPPQYQTPQYQTLPQYQTPPQYGTTQYGTTQYGTTQYGMTQTSQYLGESYGLQTGLGLPPKPVTLQQTILNPIESKQLQPPIQQVENIETVKPEKKPVQNKEEFQPIISVLQEAFTVAFPGNDVRISFLLKLSNQYLHRT